MPPTDESRETSARTSDNASEMASFLDPGFTFANEDLTEDEAQRYLAWCARIHGEGNLDLVPFAEFFVECDPRGLKRLRRHTGTLQLPIAAAVLMWAHTYCVMGFDKGVMYEAIAARELGVSKDELVEVLRIAGYFGGPFALNAAGELTLPYLRAWDASGDTPTRWPDGWTIDPQRLRSGIDHSTDELLEGELAAITSWYQVVHGGLSRSLAAAAAANPRAFKMNRVRFESLAGEHLPVQLVALLSLHTAAVCRWGFSIRRAAELARFLGVDDATIATTIHWACVVGGEWALEEAFEHALGSFDRREAVHD